MLLLNKRIFKQIQKYTFGNTDIHNISKSCHTNLLNYINKTKYIDPNKYFYHCVHNNNIMTVKWLIKYFKRTELPQQTPYIRDIVLVNTLLSAIVKNIDINCIKIFYAIAFNCCQSKAIKICAIKNNNLNMLQLHYKYDKNEPDIGDIRFAIKYNRAEILQYFTTLTDLHKKDMYFNIFVLFNRTNINVKTKYKMLSILQPYLDNKCLQFMINKALTYNFMFEYHKYNMIFLAEHYDGITLNYVKNYNKKIQKEAYNKKYIFEVKNVCNIEHKYIFI
jgi:hypothetical protein